MSMQTETVDGIHRQNATWPPRRRARRLARALAGALTAMTIAACGNSDPGVTGGASTGPGSSNPAAPAASECMRAHGVPNFPDPTQTPGRAGLSITKTPGNSTMTVAGIPFSGPGVHRRGSGLQVRSCRPRSSRVPQSTKLKELAFAWCMRKHGVPHFPDPNFPAGGGIERPEVPGLDLNSRAVQRAEVTCNR